MEKEKKQIVGFKIGQGGRFFNAGHLSFLGFGEISNFAGDEIYTRNGTIVDWNDRELCEESEWLSGIALLDFDGDYNTIYTKYLDEITQKELDAINEDTGADKDIALTQLAIIFDCDEDEIEYNID